MIKYVPVDVYDFAAVETWLTRIGERGWFPKPWDSAWIANFQKGEPKTVRYRLEPLQDVEEVRPDEEMVETYKDAGWTYIKTVSKLYHIFAAGRPDAQEPHTDPVVQSYTLTALARRARVGIATTVISLALVIGFLLYVLFVEGNIFLQLADTNLACTILAVLMLTVSGAREAVSSSRLLRLKRQLAAGEGMVHEAETAPADRHKWIRLASLTAAIVLFLFIWARQFGAFEREMNLEDYTGIYPSLAALEGAGYKTETNFTNYNGVSYYNRVDSSIECLARVTEIQQVGRRNGEDCRLEVTRYDLYIGGWAGAVRDDLARYWSGHDWMRFEGDMFDPDSGHTVETAEGTWRVFAVPGHVWLFGENGNRAVAVRYMGEASADALLKLSQTLLW